MRIAIRSLLRTPAFTLTAVLTFALGIGASVLIFAVLDAMLLRPLPFADPDRLAIIWIDDAKRGVHEEGFGYPTFEDWKRSNRSFEDIAVRGRGYAARLTGPEPERVLLDVVSANYFSVLGLTPQAGRFFSADEEQQGALVAVISAARDLRSVDSAARLRQSTNHLICMA